MASRLSSLLVRDGLVGVKRMERAFQRQVIYGGALDTILLEMSLIDEPTLCEYLSLATGLPAATAEQMEMISSEATEACPEELARSFYVAPLTVEEDALRVLVSEPVDFAQLEDLADRLDMAIQPLVAPEFRFNLLFSRAFGLPASARFKKLAETVGSIAPPKRPAGDGARATSEPPSDGTPRPADAVDGGWTMSSVFDAVSAEQELAARADTVPADDFESSSPSATLPLPTQAPSSPSTARPPPETRPPADTIPNPLPVDEPAAGDGTEEDEVLVAENADLDSEVVDVPLPASESPRSTVRFHADSLRERLEEGSRPNRVTDAYRIVRPLRAEPTPQPRTGTIHTPNPPMPSAADRGADRFEGGDLDEDLVVSGEIEPEPDEAAETTPRRAAPLGPLGVDDARDLLADADDRDAIFQILLRALSSRAGYAALAICHNNAGQGRLALDRGEPVAGEVAAASIPLELDSPFKQVSESASPYIGRLASGNPDVDAQAQKLCGGELPPTALLLPIALRDRVVAIAVAHRGGDNIEINEVAELLPLAGDVADALIRLIRDAKKRAATMSRQLAEGGDIAEISGAATADPELARLLDQVDSPVREASEEAKTALLGRAAEVVPLLDDRFPGRLEVDRYEIGWRTIRASQYGPLMDLVIKLGAACGPMLAVKLEDRRRDVRYYAAVCAAELRPQAALGALVERIFDRDFGVRDIAIHALGGYPTTELDQALSSARAALHSDSAERVVAAANALAVLADLRSIPHLLEVLEGDRETAVPARRALRRLTSQDFAWSIRKWRSWWDSNRTRNRIEWLLDSLAHRDEELRRQAVDDLRTLTGESFDFNHDAPRREREDGRVRWLQWWEREGSARFSSDRRVEHERPTARLPEIEP
jgi:HEAT repeat protein